MALNVAMPGYAKIRVAGARGLVIETCHQILETILSTGTLYSYAAARPDVRTFAGRAPVYAVSLPDGFGDVVVRHAMRGGALAKANSDLFLPPTRGLRELVNSLRLRMSGVATPEVVAFVTYRVGPVLRRSDVATREIEGGHDLWTVLSEIGSGDQRDACLRAASRLIATMDKAGAHHPDLNLRNVLVTWDGPDGATAHVLDVDRIRFHVPGDPMVAQANLARLERSIRKWRDLKSIDVSDRDISLVRPATS
ncbi:MAG: lipopolysaccharide kinase InaA family protein [Gemmatimonadaceae bacterium]